MTMNDTERARRSDALFYDGITGRRMLCDMIARLEDELSAATNRESRTTTNDIKDGGSMYDFKGKKVFLSGPMTGMPDLNREAFAEAEQLVRALGAIEVFDPTRAWGHSDRTRDWYVRNDLNRLTGSDWSQPHFDAIVMLDNWHDSRGAALEHDVAVDSGIAVVSIREVRESARDD